MAVDSRLATSIYSRRYIPGPSPVDTTVMAQRPEGWEDEAPEPTPELILEHILETVTVATAREEMTMTVAVGGYGIDSHDLD